MSGPKFLKRLECIEAFEGESVSLTCNVIGSPAPTIKWIIDDTEVTFENSHIRSKYNSINGNAELHIEKCELSDEQSYTCVASNIHGTSKTMGVLIVKKRPEARSFENINFQSQILNEIDCKPCTFVLKLPEFVKLKEGDDLKLSCHIEGHPEPDIEWYKNDVPLNDDYRVDIYNNRKVNYLEITDTTVEDSGVYKITAKNFVNKIFDTAEVKIIENTDKVNRTEREQFYYYTRRQETYYPPEFIIKPANQTIREGNNLSLFLKVKGAPTPEITWFRDGKPLKENERYKHYFKDGCNYFEILNVSFLDTGEYTCTASNVMGAVYSAISIIVEGMTEPETEIDTVSDSDGSKEQSPIYSQKETDIESISSDKFEKVKKEIVNQLVEKHVIEHVKRKKISRITKEKEIVLEKFILQDDFVDKNNKISLQKNTVVELLDNSKPEKWLVRNKNDIVQVFYVHPDLLEEISSGSEENEHKVKRDAVIHFPRQAIAAEESSDVDTSTSDDFQTMTEEMDMYIVNWNETSIFAENQQIEILDSQDYRNYLVRTKPRRDDKPKVGWIPECFIDKKVINSKNISTTSLVIPNLISNLIETEKIYVKDLQFIVENYLQELSKTECPAYVIDNKDSVFANVDDIFAFHKVSFLTQLLENTNLEFLSKIFLKCRYNFEIYIPYIINRKNSKNLIYNNPQLNEYFEHITKKLNQDITSIDKLLNRPIDRIMLYKTFWQDFIRNTSIEAKRIHSSLMDVYFMFCDIYKRIESKEIIESFENLPEEISGLLDRIIRLDTFYMLEKSRNFKKRQIFLFKDILLISEFKHNFYYRKNEIDKSKSDELSKKGFYVLKKFIKFNNIRSIKVENIENYTGRLYLQIDLHDKKDYEFSPFEQIDNNRVILKAKNPYVKLAFIKALRDYLFDLIGSTDSEDIAKYSDELTRTSNKPSRASSKKRKPEERYDFESNISSFKRRINPFDRHDRLYESSGNLSNSSSSKKQATTDGLTVYETVDSESSYHTAAESEEFAPKFLMSLHSNVPMEGETAVLECEIAGNPKPILKWLKDDKPIEDDYYYKFFENQNNSYTLEIEDAKVDDCGIYTVIATNSYGTITANCQLSVYESNILIKIFLKFNKSEYEIVMSEQEATLIENFNDSSEKTEDTEDDLYDDDIFDSKVNDLKLELNEDFDDDMNYETFDVYVPLAGYELQKGKKASSESDEDLSPPKSSIETKTITTMTIEENFQDKNDHKDIDNLKTAETFTEDESNDYPQIAENALKAQKYVKKVVLGSFDNMIMPILSSAENDADENIVNEESVFDEPLSDTGFVIGEDDYITLACRLKPHCENIMIRWLKDGELIDLDNDKYENIKEMNIRALIINDMNENDVGTYECVIGYQKCSCELSIVTERIKSRHSSLASIASSKYDSDSRSSRRRSHIVNEDQIVVEYSLESSNQEESSIEPIHDSSFVSITAEEFDRITKNHILGNKIFAREIIEENDLVVESINFEQVSSNDQEGIIESQLRLASDVHDEVLLNEIARKEKVLLLSREANNVDNLDLEHVSDIETTIEEIWDYPVTKSHDDNCSEEFDLALKKKFQILLREKNNIDDIEINDAHQLKDDSDRVEFEEIEENIEEFSYFFEMAEKVKYIILANGNHEEEKVAVEASGDYIETYADKQSLKVELVSVDNNDHELQLIKNVSKPLVTLKESNDAVEVIIQKSEPICNTLSNAEKLEISRQELNDVYERATKTKPIIILKELFGHDQVMIEKVLKDCCNFDWNSIERFNLYTSDVVKIETYKKHSLFEVAKPVKVNIFSKENIEFEKFIVEYVLKDDNLSDHLKKQEQTHTYLILNKDHKNELNAELQRVNKIKLIILLRGEEGVEKIESENCLSLNDEIFVKENLESKFEKKIEVYEVAREERPMKLARENIVFEGIPILDVVEINFIKDMTKIKPEDKIHDLIPVNERALKESCIKLAKENISIDIATIENAESLKNTKDNTSILELKISTQEANDKLNVASKQSLLILLRELSSREDTAVENSISFKKEEKIVGENVEPTIYENKVVSEKIFFVKPLILAKEKMNYENVDICDATKFIDSKELKHFEALEKLVYHGDDAVMSNNLKNLKKSKPSVLPKEKIISEGINVSEATKFSTSVLNRDSSLLESLKNIDHQGNDKTMEDNLKSVNRSEANILLKEKAKELNIETANIIETKYENELKLMKKAEKKEEAQNEELNANTKFVSISKDHANFKFAPEFRTKACVKLEKNFDNCAAHQGDECTFTCVIKGEPTDIIIFKDSALLETKKNEKKFNLAYDKSNGNVVLKIKNIDVSDEGEYGILVKNNLGFVESRAFLDIEFSHSHVEQINAFSLQNQRFRPPPNLKIVENYEDEIKLKWEKFDNAQNISYILEYFVANSESWITLLKNLKSSNVVVENLKPCITYSFRVRAENNFGVSNISNIVSVEMPKKQKDINEANIFKYEPQKLFSVSQFQKTTKTENVQNKPQAPYFLQTFQDANVLLQGDIRLRCEVDGNPYPEVKFYKDWKLITDSHHVRINHSENLWEVEIKKCFSGDQGLYSCVAKNSEGQVSCSSNVNVNSSLEIHSITNEQQQQHVTGKKDFADEYEILEEISRNSYMATYRILHKKQFKEYIAKIPLTRDHFKKIKREYDCLYMVQSDNYFVKSYELCETVNGLPVLVLEEIKGENLIKCLLNQNEIVECECQVLNDEEKIQINEETVAAIVKELLLILKELHSRNVIHLGINNENIIVEKSSGKIKLIGFTYAERCKGTSVNHEIKLNERHFLKYIEFMAPEIVKNEQVSPKSDLWSLGVLCYVLLSGISPFFEEDFIKTSENLQNAKFEFGKEFKYISSNAKDFINKLLQKNAGERLSADKALDHQWLNNVGSKEMKRFLPSEILLQYFLRQYWNYNEKKLDEHEKIFAAKIMSLTSSNPVYQHYSLSDDIEIALELQKLNSKQGNKNYLIPVQDPFLTVRLREYTRVRQTSPMLSYSTPSSRHSSPMLESNVYNSIFTHKTLKERCHLEKNGKIVGYITNTRFEYTYNSILNDMIELNNRGSVDKFSVASSLSSAPQYSKYVCEKCPPVISEKLKNASFIIGYPIVLRCKVDGKPFPHVSWYFNNALIDENDERIKFIQASDGSVLLKIAKTKISDIGVYKCVAQSKHGVAFTKAYITISDVPTAPSRPIITQFSWNKCSLCWNEPKFIGSSNILCYKVEYKMIEDALWTTALYTTSKKCVLNGLEQETCYIFRVSCINSVGVSDFSPVSAELKTLKEGEKEMQTIFEFSTLSPHRNIFKESESAKQKNEHHDEFKIDVKGYFENSFKIDSEILLNGSFYKICRCVDKTNTKKGLAKFVKSVNKNELYLNSKAPEKYFLKLIEITQTNEPSWSYTLVYEDAIPIFDYLTLNETYCETLIVEIIKQLCVSLEWLHSKGFIHMNVNPISVFTRSKDQLNVRLSGFDKLMKTNEAIKFDDQLISPFIEFISPEVIKREEITQTSDIWSIGVLTAIMLCGSSCFQRNVTDTVIHGRIAYDSFNDEVSPDGIKFIQKCLQHMPSQRLNAGDCLNEDFLLKSSSRKNSIQFSSEKLKLFYKKCLRS